MAHASVSPQTANIKDGDIERFGADLEDGELEEGELDDVDASVSVKEVPALIPEISAPTPVSAPVLIRKKEKVKEKSNVRLGGKRKSAHHHYHQERNKDHSEPEDEWAGVVEKAIKRAMGKDPSVEKTYSEGANEMGNLSPNGRKYKQKKRKNKHRENCEEEDDEDEEEEEERKEIKKRKRSHCWNDREGIEGSIDEKVNEEEEEYDEDDDEDDDDDDEMLYIRGASPVMREVYLDEASPSSSGYMDSSYTFNEQGGQYDENFDSYGEDESDFENQDEFPRLPGLDDDGPKRGGGRGIKRKHRGTTRLIQPNKRQNRKETKTKRGSSKRQQQSRSNNQERGSDCICMFFMQGKCQKGDDCPYSHNALPPRKMELCKFYLMDCCAKKDKCLYMHHDFPCKFFHTGLKCFSGPRCKFSHGHLTDTMRAVLLKHLETAPKEILGDFPRLSREGAAAMVYSKKNRNKTKKIPSLFDIEVPIPAQLLAEQKETTDDQSPNRRTPIPESDNEEEEKGIQVAHLSPKLEVKSATKVRSQNSDDEKFPSESEERDFSDVLELERKLPSVESELQDEGEKKREDKVKKEGRSKRELNLLRLAGYSPDPDLLEEEEKTESYSEVSPMEKVDDHEKEIKSREVDDQEDVKQNTESTVENIRDSQLDTGESGGESNEGGSIPLHLPKKQRELFLRIQQQQRQAENSQDLSGGDNNDEDSQQGENWYSSDEEDDSLTNVLKNLSRQDGPSNLALGASTAVTTAANSTTTTTITNTTLFTTTTTTTTSSVLSPAPTFDKFNLADLSKIDISESVSKLLSSIRNQQQVEEISIPKDTSTKDQLAPLQPSNPTPARDPRLSRDPRNRNQNNRATTGGPVTCITTDVAALPSVTVTATAAASVTTLSSPSGMEPSHTRRSDPRRIHDPRKMDHRHHTGSVSSRRSSGGSSHVPTFTSIYSNAITSESVRSSSSVSGQMDRYSSSDIDLRNILSQKDIEISDIDLRHSNKLDLDLRPPIPFGDTDLRLKSRDLSSIGQLVDRGTNDVDFRRILELPFKPVPVHTPATEIDASLTSHLPIPYKVTVITIPRPDYTSLKLNTSDPQVQNDPRLRKLFKLNSSPSSTSTTKTSAPTVASPMPSPVSRVDPRSATARGARGNIPGTASNSGASNSSLGPFHSAGGIANIDHHSNQVHMLPDRFSEFSSMTAMSPTVPKRPHLSSSPVSHGNIVPALLANLALPTQNALASNFDPRMPRNPRHAPGLLGPAPLPPNYCPNTPLFEDQEENSSGSDNDPRMFYNRMNPIEAAMWEQQQHQQQQHQQQHSQRNSWKSNQRNQQQRT